MNTLDPTHAALVVIDVQRAFDLWEAAGKRRNNPDAVARIADLLAAFRAARLPVFHIRHRSARPGSSFAPDGPGYPVRDEACEMAGEPVVVKEVNSAFIGTDLEARLRAADVKDVVLAGFMTHMCVNSTARGAFNLGFRPTVVAAATATRDLPGADGALLPAAVLQAASLAALGDLFAVVAPRVGDVPA